jgi:MFS family permease
VVFNTTITGTTCGSTDLHIGEVNKIPVTDDTENASEEHGQLLLTAKRMTQVSLYYEFAIALLILLSIFGCIYMCCNGELDWTYCSYKALKPFILFDCAVIIILGPFGNVYLFLLGCVDAYVKILLRIGFYLSTIFLPAAFSYIDRQKDNPDPNADSFKSILSILVKLGLKLASCSSCLATFIDIAYPEALPVRFAYLAFTIIVGLSALATYYETLLKLLEMVKDWEEECVPLHSWLNHFIFWPSMVAYMGLLGLNSYILYKYSVTAGGDLDLLDSSSPAVSLGLNLVSLVYLIANYVLFAVFCGHGPLKDICSQYFSSIKDKCSRSV